MVYDILKKIRALLLADGTIATEVGTNISVKEMPSPRVVKQITINKDYGKADSILPTCSPTIFIKVWVSEKDVTEPYSTCATILEKCNDILNRKGETLNISGLVIHQVVRTDGSIYWVEGQNLYVGVLTFNCVTND